MEWGLWGTMALCVVLGSAGCTTSRAPLGGQCELSTECQNPLVCRLARCRRECATVRDCPAGSLCVTDNDGIGSCRIPEEAVCGRDSDCPVPLKCRHGECTNECTRAPNCERDNRCDVDCAPGSRCDEESLGCEDPAEDLCVRDRDCRVEGDTEALVCAIDRRCRQECVNDRDCRQGAECNETGSCAPIQVSMDGGADADTGIPADSAVDGAEDSAVDSTVDGAMDSALDGAVDSGADAASSGPACPGGIADCTGTVGLNATIDCVAGFCTIVSCRGGMENCDGRYSTGCESFTETDVQNCGACGTACSAGQICADTCMTGAVADLELGGETSCALFTTGHVACWGRNRQGEVGTGTDPLFDSQRSAPSLVVGLTNATDLTMTMARYSGSVYSHACARRGDGTVVCWGANRFGQTGTTGVLGESTPVVVPGLTDAEELSSGTSFTCARRTGGAVACWGNQEFGRLGNGMTTAASVATPGAVATLTGVTEVVSTGGAYACASVGASSYRCWGAGGANSTALGAGDLGIGSASWIGTPIDATALTGLGLTGLRGGGGAMYGIDGTGRVRCWGSSTLFACGPTTAATLETPYQYTEFSGVAQVESMSNFAVARLSTGELHCWGRNNSGQCGLGRTDSPIYPPEAVPGVTDATDLAVGYSHVCIVRSSGGVWCAGENFAGQLGNGRSGGGEMENAFVRVMGLP